jgi:hypothetical protein
MMFARIFLREWKDKAALFLFGLGILILFSAALLVLPAKKDLLEWLTYALLLLYFPFMALIFGSGGFETEFRDGAWAYLFSRPVSKASVWFAKYASLLSMLSALWLGFLVIWLVIPGTREIASGAVVPLGFHLESGFPLWSLWLSVFLLTVSFSLSILHEKPFQILFLALAAASGLTLVSWLILGTPAGGNIAWANPPVALTALFIGQILAALAFAAASLSVFMRMDFSQTWKKASGFAVRSGSFLVLALLATAAYGLISPGLGGHYLWQADSLQGGPYYATQRGVFEYSAEAGRIRWIVRGKSGLYFTASTSHGKIGYIDFDVRSRTDASEELWIVNADGSGRRRVLGGKTKAAWPSSVGMTDLMISPDQTKIMVLVQNRGKGQTDEKSPLWAVNADGSGLKNLPFDSALLRASQEPEWLRFAAWVRNGRGLLIQKAGARATSPSLWLYDLETQRASVLLDNAYAFMPVSPRGDTVALERKAGPGTLGRLAFLDLKTLRTTDIDVEGDPVHSRVSWDARGDQIATVIGKHPKTSPREYALAVCSLTAKKLTAEKVMTEEESTALLFNPSWTADGSRLILLNRSAHALDVLRADLNQEKRIALPPAIRLPVELQVVGDQALVIDNQTDSLWRFDLKRASWKKLY